jgi:dihydropteroate synthase
VIERLAPRIPVPVSVDTSKASVAKASLDAGALIVNDVRGLRDDARLAEVVARSGAVAVLVENSRGRPYRDLLPDIQSRLRESVALAQAAGVPPERIIVDPGLGFGKTVAQNLEIVHCLKAMRALGLPLLVGPSRKSTIGQVLQLPVEDRLEGTEAVVAIAIANGADLVRVHDVRAMVRVARMADAIVRLSGTPD